MPRNVPFNLTEFCEIRVNSVRAAVIMLGSAERSTAKAGPSRSQLPRTSKIVSLLYPENHRGVVEKR